MRRQRGAHKKVEATSFSTDPIPLKEGAQPSMARRIAGSGDRADRAYASTVAPRGGGRLAMWYASGAQRATRERTWISRRRALGAGLGARTSRIGEEIASASIWAAMTSARQAREIAKTTRKATSTCTASTTSSGAPREAARPSG